MAYEDSRDNTCAGTLMIYEGLKVAHEVSLLVVRQSLVLGFADVA